MRNYGMERRRREERLFNPEAADPPYGGWPVFEQDSKPELTMFERSVAIVAVFAVAVAVMAGVVFLR